MMKESEPKHVRLLIIDELKTFGILAIVLSHFIGGNLSLEYVSIPYRDIGLTLFILASGMGLAFGCPSITTFSALKEFYTKRFLRIYPIYWIFVLILLIWAMSMHYFTLPTWTPLQWFGTFFGFQAFFGDFNGRLSVTFWFIGTIVSLYILYPVILWAHNRNKHITIGALFIISLLSTYLVSSVSSDPFAPLWFPLCRIFEFGLGIYLMSIINPAQVAYQNVVLFLLADLSYYIYLTHYPLIGTLPRFGGWALPAYIILTLLSAYLLYRIDRIIQTRIRHFLLKQTDQKEFSGQSCGKGRRRSN
jgi:peptidoglycan/LPS O-acetylase OafA/YrhL